MITNRLAKGLRELDWLTVVIEALLVVGGILVALEVQKWADDQEDLELYREALDQLRSEIDANLEQIDQRVERTERLADANIEAARALLICDTSPEALRLINRGLLMFLIDISPGERMDSLDAIQSNPRFSPLIPSAITIEAQRLKAFSERMSNNADGNKNLITYFARSSLYVRISYEANADLGLPVLAKPVDEVCKDNQFTGQLWFNALLHDDLTKTYVIMKERFSAFKASIDAEYQRVGGIL